MRKTIFGVILRMRSSLAISFLILFSLMGNAQAPTSHATGLAVSDIYCSSVTLNWTNGNGGFRLVIAFEGTAITDLPVDNVFYFGNKDYGVGSALGANQYVVYNGSGNRVVVDNLKKNTIYHFAVIEFNGGGTAYNYYTEAGYATISAATRNISVDFIIDDPYQCENVNLFTYTSSASQDASTPLDYLWKFGDGTTATTGNAAHTYSDYAIYDVSLEVSSFKCNDTMIRQDTVAPLPEFTLGLLQDSVDRGYTQDQCFFRPDGKTNFYYFKADISFKPLRGAVYDETSQFWKFGDGNTDNIGLSNRHSYVEPGNYTVRLIQSTTNNRREFCVDSSEVIVRVFPSPIDTTLIQFDSIQCFENNVFTFEHNNPNPDVVNQWDFGDGNSDVGNQVSHSFSNSGIYDFELRASDQNGCLDTFTNFVDVVPQPNNEITGLNPRYCAGDEDVTLGLTIPTGQWLTNLVNANTNVFSPIGLGENVLRYAADVDGCKDTAEVSTTIFPVPRFELGRDTSVCRGESILLSIGKDSSTVSWSTGASDSFTSVTEGGILWAEKLSNGCRWRDSINVQQISAPNIDLGADSLLCGDGVRSISIQAAEATYTWEDGYTGGGQRDITSSGTYKLVAENKCGKDSAEVTLEFLPYVCDIFIPNAFTPNGDGVNDIFRPSGNVEIRSMEIFNRWGEKLYASYNVEDGFSWDGIYQDKKAQGGHYFFIIRYLLPGDSGVSQEVASGEFYLIE